jgi:hypothetical protein
MEQEQKRPELNEAKVKDIFRDYRIKIWEKLDKLGQASGSPLRVDADDINNMVILLNWCFSTRNNFFSRDFNRNSIYGVSTMYNQLKSNILLEEDGHKSFFDNITVESIKVLKYIMNQYISVYEELSKDNYYNELCKRVSKDSVRRCVLFMNDYITAARAA